LYPKNRVPRLVEEDNERYHQALARLGVSLAAPDPVGAVTRRYEGTLVLSEAAAEVGLPEAEVRKRLAKSPELARALRASLAKGGTVQRQVFQDAFGEIAAALAEKPVLPPTAKVAPFAGFTGSIQCVAIHPQGQQVAAGGDDRLLRLWDLKTGQEIR